MWNKDPNDTADYAIDWTDVLNGDTIASFDDLVITPATSPALAEFGSPSRLITDTTTIVWLTGGIAGQTYTLDQTVTTAGGRTFQRAQLLFVQESVPIEHWPIVVTFSQAKSQLGLAGTTEHDTLIQMYLTHAHALVLDYVKQRRTDQAVWLATIMSWTPDTVPPQVQAAILYQLNQLFRFRGDDAVKDQNTDGLLPPMVRAYVAQLRHPVVS